MPQELRIPVSRFKAHCLRLLDEVSKRKLRLIVTKRGKPLARIEAADQEPLDVHGWLKGTVKVRGDLTAPLDVDWDALGESP